MSANMKIVSIGTYIPRTIESNYDKAEKFGYDRNFLENKLGFVSTAKKTETETTLSMCLEAYRNLTEKRNIITDNIKVVTVVTQNPFLRIPHTAALIHNALNLKDNCMTFDISQGCSGYCHALQIVSALMESMDLTEGLIFTCDSYDNIMDADDKNVSMIFGDGATATLVSREARSGYLLVESVFGTARDSSQCLTIVNDKIHMNGWEITQLARTVVPGSINKLLRSNGLCKEEIDRFILHQGSRHIIRTLQRELEVSDDKIIFSAGKIGNTVSSSLPIQLAGHIEENLITNTILSGFGVGFTWGTCLLRYLKVND